jgi:hypothetical protein
MKRFLLWCAVLISLSAVSLVVMVISHSTRIAIPGPGTATSNAALRSFAQFPARNVSVERSSQSVKLVSSIINLPLSFEPNTGQADARFSFISRGHGYSLLTSGDTATLSLCVAGSDHNPTARLKTKRCSAAAFQMHFLGANASASAVGEQELSGKSNYFRGNNPTRWRTNVPHFKRARYADVYPGIDVVYYGNRQKLEYDLLVNPGAKPQEINFAIDVVGEERRLAPADIQKDGALEVVTTSGTILLQPPLAYQEDNGETKIVAIHYSKKGPNRIGFEIGAYDRTKSLIIDPVLTYSGFIGGSSDDFGYAVAVDVAGNLYVTGGTTSPDFPVTTGVAQTSYAGADSNTQGVQGDVFVIKIDPAGEQLLYSTYLGGTADDNAYAISVDSAGNAYLAGATNSADFPVTQGVVQTTFGGGPNDAFVAKLNPAGSALVYSTYLGTAIGGERGFGIASDLAGDAYVTGDAAPDFPVTTGSFRGGVNDAQLTELNPSGTSRIFSRFFGGNGLDEGYAIAVDAAGNISITGATTSTDLPVTGNAAQANLAGGRDAFVAQFDRTGSLIYCSYIGGTADELGTSLGAVALDRTGRIYVTGSTASADYPTTASAFQTTYAGGISDVFVTAIDPLKQNSVVYSTLLGGSAEDDFGQFARGITVDIAQNAVITGNTTSANFPTLRAVQSTGGGGEDAFVSKLNATGSALIFSTYLGGVQNEYGAGVITDKTGNTYVTGQTGSADFPSSSPVQASLNGPTDTFIVKLGADFNLSSSPASASITAGQTATFNVTVNPSDGLFGSPVSLACAGAPSLSTCTVSPQQVTPGTSAVPATITITTTAPQSSAFRALAKSSWSYALLLPFLCFSCRTKRFPCSTTLRAVGRSLGLALLLSVGLLVGCGGGSSPKAQPKPGTPTGISTITITGSSTSVTHTTTLKLDVM